MKIIKLQAENIKKLKAVEITPDSNLVQITGANAQGKTSVLDSIWYALGGKSAVDTMPIRDGEDEAFVQLEFENFIVTRTFKLKDNVIKTSILIEGRNGSIYKSPQAILNGLVGKLSFDPLEFSRLKPKEQFDLLRDICNIDFDFEEAETERQKIYDKRTDINREAKALEIAESNIIVDNEQYTIKKDPQEILQNLKEAQAFNALQKRNEQDIQQLQEHSNMLLNELEEKKKYVQRNVEMNNSQIDKLIKQKGEEKDILSLTCELDSIININKNADKFERKAKIHEQHNEKKEMSDECTKKLKEIDFKKIAALKEAKMPIEKLSIDNGQVLYNEIPFEQLSGAEKLKISLAIAAAANPKIRVLRITDGSLLDSSSMDELLKFANEKDYQIWIERVDETGDVGVCIHDGNIKEA